MNHKKHIIGLGIVVLVLSTVYLSLLAMQNNVNVGETANSGNPPANNGNDNLPGGISARLTGHGESDSLGMKMTIAAVINANKDIAGGVSGQTVAWKNFKAVVTEVVPPSGDKDYWCINSVIRDPENAVGINLLWFIRDLGTQDQVTVDSRTDVTCATVPPPDNNSFAPLSKGDFKGDIRN